MKWTSGTIKRSVAIAGLGVAFLVMASVFAPDRTRAGDAQSTPYGPSTDPHEGLAALGSLEDDGYRVHIYATDDGPRYSIYDISTGRELGVLLKAEQVEELFPDLPVPSMDFATSGPLMFAEPRSLE